MQVLHNENAIGLLVQALLEVLFCMDGSTIVWSWSKIAHLNGFTNK